MPSLVGINANALINATHQLCTVLNIFFQHSPSPLMLENDHREFWNFIDTTQTLAVLVLDNKGNGIDDEEAANNLNHTTTFELTRQICDELTGVFLRLTCL